MFGPSCVGNLVEQLPPVEPAQLCQLCFILATGGVLAVAAVPPGERQLLLNYGARASTTADITTTVAADATDRDERAHRESSALLRTVSNITSFGQVPHSWFISFYLSYLACSLFWAFQYFQDGFIFQYLTTQQQAAQKPSMSFSQALTIWLLMACQAARRLYECIVTIRPSKSKMWFVHWVLGLSFYLGMSLAVWIEGSESLLESHLIQEKLQVPPRKTILALPLFIFAWTMQHRCHKYLAGLKKYSLPEKGMFRWFVCPHYTCECLLYLSLVIGAAPRGQLYNRTVLCALIFVAVNLGVTAYGTKKWYIEKFGVGKVADKWTMIPFVY